LGKGRPGEGRTELIAKSHRRSLQGGFLVEKLNILMGGRGVVGRAFRAKNGEKIAKKEVYN